MSERPQNRHLKPFKPGQSGNPSGRNKIRDDLKDVKLLSKADVKRLIQKIIDMSPEELLELSNDKTVPALEHMMASVVINAVKQGDQARINFLLEQTIGKVAEKHEHEMVDVTYKTEVLEDGSLLQKIHDEEKEAKK